MKLKVFSQVELSLFGYSKIIVRRNYDLYAEGSHDRAVCHRSFLLLGPVLSSDLPAIINCSLNQLLEALATSSSFHHPG